MRFTVAHADSWKHTIQIETRDGFSETIWDWYRTWYGVLDSSQAFGLRRPALLSRLRSNVKTVDFGQSLIWTAFLLVNFHCFKACIIAYATFPDDQSSHCVGENAPQKYLRVAFLIQTGCNREYLVGLLLPNYDCLSFSSNCDSSLHIRQTTLKPITL